ncbi:MAG: sensor histidine kinase [Vicinamibacterales bacterium]
MSFVSARMMTSTLRGRLTVWHLSVLTMTLTLFGALCYLVLARNLYQHHDHELSHQAIDVVRALEAVPLREADIRQALQQTPMGSRFVMIRDREGSLIYRDPVLASSEPNIGEQEALVHAAAAAPRVPLFFTVDLERSAEVRFICAPLSQGGSYLQIGDPLGDVRTMLRSTVLACLPILPGVLLLSGIGGWVIVKRALGPVREVTATLRHIQATDLSRRVEVHPTDVELAALVSSLNDVLERLQRSFEALREFAGDLSHQIQTPLTILKGELESARQHPERARDRAWLDGLTDEVEQMRAIIVDLRSLALADAPITDDGPVDWSAIVREAGDIIAAIGELRGVTVSCRAPGPVRVRGDATRLKQVVLNLGDNAVRYTPPGGSVSIGLDASGGTAVLHVVDSGIGIAAEDVPRVFDRLFRSDVGRRHAEGTGLGLAIVKRIVNAHRGSVDVRSQVGSGSTFTVTLPTT